MRTRPLSQRTLLRFHVVSQVQARLLRGERKSHAIAAVAAIEHACGERLVRVSPRSIERWLARQQGGGVEALKDQQRPRTDGSRVLDQKLLDYFVDQRDDDAFASIPELIRRAREKGIEGSDGPICRQTVFRALRRRGVPTRRRKRRRDHDCRRFATPHRMDLVLCDGKHFRAGIKRVRRMVYTFLDDSSRFGLEMVVGTSENASLFLGGFYKALRRYGKMSVLYLDKGPGFIANAVADVCAAMEINLVFGKTAYPEGHGKIEKFNQTMLDAVLRNLNGRPDVDADCGALQLRLLHWLRETYNHTPHESLPVEANHGS